MLTTHIEKIAHNIKGSRAAITLLTCLILSACSSSDVEITTTFNNTKDIKEGAPVYFNDVVVGEVSDVISYQNGSRVAISLDPSAAAQLSARSAAVVNRLKDGAPLELYNRAKLTANDQALSDGQEIRGLDSIFQLGAWMIGDAIQVGMGSISQYVDSFQQYLLSDEFANDKEKIEIEVNGATMSAVQAMEAMGKDLNQAINELADSEEEIAAAVEQLGNELSPVVEELAKSGSRLAAELEKFATGLEAAAPAEQQTGQRLIDSLIAMLEKLNASMERGAADMQDDSASVPAPLPTD